MLTAVAYSEDGNRPLLELAAEEFIFQLAIDQGAAEFPVRFHMRPYPPAQMKQLVGELSPTIESKGKKLITRPSSTDEYIDFFDRHFIKMSGKIQDEEGEDPTIDWQKTWLETAIPVKLLTVVDGYWGIKTEELNGAPPQRLVLAAPTGKKIVTTVPLFSEKSGIEESIKLVHHCRQETRQEYAAWSKATAASERHLRKQEQKIVQDHDTVERLYDSLIEKLDGAVLLGTPCVAENKDKWVDHVPYWYKNFALTESFREVARRNF